MTVGTPEGPGTDLANPDDTMTGLEDFDMSTDMVMPRLRIIGKDAQFEDNLTNERHDKIRVILLGFVKQRILWPAEQGEDASHPLCRSLDFTTGHPDLATFPWKESGFPAPAADAEGLTLVCGNCGLKEWGSNPKSSTPWCSEQHTFPLLLQVGDAADDNYQPAILTLQRSGLKASRSYVSGFVRSRDPLYGVYTEIVLTAQKRGSVNYATPVLTKREKTDPAMAPVYAKQLREIRTYLTTPRDDYEEARNDTPSAATTPAGAGAPLGDDDEPAF